MKNKYVFKEWKEERSFNPEYIKQICEQNYEENKENIDGIIKYLAKR